MTRWLYVLVLWLVACAGGIDATDVRDPIEVRTWLDGTPSQSIGILIVQIDANADLKVQLPEPEIEGLEVLEVGTPRVERVGERSITTRRYRFTGEPGTYEIKPVSVAVTTDDGEVAGSSQALWVALDLDKDPLADMADIDEPSRVWSVDTITMLQIGGALLCAIVGAIIVLLLLRLLFGGRGPSTLPPESADVVALRAWEAVRNDDSLDDLDKAKALAAIFRTYTETALSFPATAWTTTEIVAHLQAMAHLADGNTGRAKRILRATDRIKFADANARASLFEELDDALRTFIGSTRPRTWNGDA